MSMSKPKHRGVRDPNKLENNIQYRTYYRNDYNRDKNNSTNNHRSNTWRKATKMQLKPNTRQPQERDNISTRKQ